ncbi:CopD family protein [Pelagibacterium sp. H642]|uniref:CopD family protein n=1 Tax=Pelagibacterium sp. H642 TaxID=1881069 RepID=UPI00281558D7|nr:CopD family protein [Pelagibacterium sp. H642]WMT90240.1 CopD family protein [Pelagibacterium sp. H642]
MITVFKFVHIATISIWAAGLICLPFLFAQRKDVGHEAALHRLHAMVRFLYVVILSPTAFVAIGSGTVLVFLRSTFEPWFGLKLFFVGIMVLIHLLSGLLVLSLFDESARYSRLRYIAFTGGTLAVVSAILAVVLAKPEFDTNRLTPDWLAPGQLSEIAGGILGWDLQ